MKGEQHAIVEVVRAFDDFKEAYDVFISKVEAAVPEEVEDEQLWDQVTSLVLGSEEIAIYLRDYGYTVDRLRLMAHQTGKLIQRSQAEDRLIRARI